MYVVESRIIRDRLLFLAQSLRAMNDDNAANIAEVAMTDILNYETFIVTEEKQMIYNDRIRTKK